MLKNIGYKLVLKFHLQILHLQILLLLEKVLFSWLKFIAERRGFILADLYDEDVIDNIDYAAVALNQPLVLRFEDGLRLLGPALTKSNLEIYELLKIKKQITTSQLAALMDLSVQNASSKLKKLVDEGYILRSEETAETGGIEFVYVIIG